MVDCRPAGDVSGRPKAWIHLEIFTLGHSLRPPEELAGILESRRIGFLVDVRRFPGERKNPGHGQESLERLCLDHRVTYLGLGRQLGGARPEGYRAYQESEAFQAGLVELLDVARRKPTVILCHEAFYFRCHRKYLADELSRGGWTVTHLLDAERSFRHRPGNYRMSPLPDESE